MNFIAALQFANCYNLQNERFTWCIKSLADCEDVTARSARELLKNDGFYRVLVRIGDVKTDGCRTLHAKDVTEMLQKQIEFGKI